MMPSIAASPKPISIRVCLNSLHFIARIATLIPIIRFHAQFANTGGPNDSS